MGYVKFIETLGDISKTYEFGLYEDFKDWENGQVMVNSKELFVEIGKPVFQVGDKVKLVRVVGEFEPGDVGYVRCLNEDGTVDSLWTEDKQDYWYVEEGDFVRFEE